MATATPEFVGLKAACELLDASPGAVKKMLRSGVLSGRIIPGARPKIEKDSIERLIRAHSYGDAAAS